MIKKFIFSMFLVLLGLNFCAAAFAADVYISTRGKHYHLAGCARLQGKKTAILDETQAKMRGIKPCPICYHLADEKGHGHKREKKDKN